MKLVMAKRGGGMGMGGRGGGMQFGKIGLKLDRMNLHALADRQNEKVEEEVGRIFVSLGCIITRSLKSGLVPPTQIFGLFGPPKKRINFDKFNQRQKCVFCVLTALYVSK